MHYVGGSPVKTAGSTTDNGGFIDSAYAIGGYSDFFAASTRGVISGDLNPPQSTVGCCNQTNFLSNHPWSFVQERTRNVLPTCGSYQLWRHLKQHSKWAAA